MRGLFREKSFDCFATVLNYNKLDSFGSGEPQNDVNCGYFREQFLLTSPSPQRGERICGRTECNESG